MKGFLSKIFSIVFLTAFASVAFTDDLDQQKIGELIKKRDDIVQKMEPPSNKHEKEGVDRAAEIMKRINSESYQKRVQAETERLKQTVFKEHALTVPGSNESTAAEHEGLAQDERIYLFVSSSVPIHTLRNYASAIDKVEDPRILLVMRGFVDGMKDWKAMLDFSQKVLVKNSLCDAVKEQCDMYVTNLQIDPLLFRRYDVSLVPAIVYARGVNRHDAALSEGLNNVATVSEFYSMRGDVSLEYFLEILRRETKSRSVDNVLTALKRSYYDGE
jgi:type-F conjugative transfer system pilin assembly protein TrbC